MDPDATYKSILSYAIMVEELMHWLVADRHGMHALVDALDFSTLTRMHEQSVSDAGARWTAARRVIGPGDAAGDADRRHGERCAVAGRPAICGRRLRAA